MEIDRPDDCPRLGSARRAPFCSAEKCLKRGFAQMGEKSLNEIWATGFFSPPTNNAGTDRKSSLTKRYSFSFLFTEIAVFDCPVGKIKFFLKRMKLVL